MGKTIAMLFAGCSSGGNWKASPASLLRLTGCGLQSKKADGDRKLSEMMQQMEQLELEKKELELKNRILENDLQNWQDHVEELWGKSSLIWPVQQQSIHNSAQLAGRLHAQALHTCLLLKMSIAVSKL